MTDNKNEKITIDDLLLISQQKAKTAVALAAAEKASADYRVSESEYRSLIVGVYHKYGLSNQDKVNDSTGEIMYGESEQAQSEETPATEVEKKA